MLYYSLLSSDERDGRLWFWDNLPKITPKGERIFLYQYDSTAVCGHD
jgi:hypothetical protein